MCAESDHQGGCAQSDELGSLTGVLCTIELAKALEKGYKIDNIFDGSYSDTLLVAILKHI